MQITKAEVIPVELKLSHPVRMAHMPDIRHVTAVFVRLETRKGHNAWGCAVAHPQMTGVQPQDLLRACQACAVLVPDLPPTNLEYSLDQLNQVAQSVPAAQCGALCAFELAWYDLLSLIAGLPLYRMFGGYRNRIQTSVTIPLSALDESVERAEALARLGFRVLKIKGGMEAEVDVQRVQAIHRALPILTLRLDADGGYTVSQALDVARALTGQIEMLEQPTSPDNLDDLCQVNRLSPVPILADQSVSSPASALNLAAHKAAAGFSLKVANCGGLRAAQQIDGIARAAHITTLVGCLIEPALLIAAGLSIALSSPNVRYGDLDGNLEIINDPTVPGFILEDGWLVASDVPGLGCTVKLE